jgi:protein TonB
MDGLATRLLYQGWMRTVLLALPVPRLPASRLQRVAVTLAIAGSIHGVVATAVILAGRTAVGAAAAVREATAPATAVTLPPRLVFLPSRLPGGGGGGGGNRQTGPIRRAEGIGHDDKTLRTVRRPQVEAQGVGLNEPAIPAIVLDAMPLASGNFNQAGLPEGGVSYGTSTGPGSGGGVGSGVGTGLGSGRGPGVGPGSGGGFGGGAYQPGAGISAPQLISQVKPRYTSAALERKIQGSVWLEIVVTREGRAGDVRVARSLDPGGLDEEAVVAVRLWRFQPGRVMGVPVDVLVTVVMDFSIR